MEIISKLSLYSECVCVCVAVTEGTSGGTGGGVSPLSQAWLALA